MDQLPILGVVYFLGKAMLVYAVTQWIMWTFPAQVRIDQMMAFAWKVLVPMVLALILWQMIALKLPALTCAICGDLDRQPGRSCLDCGDSEPPLVEGRDSHRGARIRADIFDRHDAFTPPSPGN